MSTATMTADKAVKTVDPLKVFISRVLRAPRRRVFEAWTRAEEMQRWRGPVGFTVLDASSDARPGGEHRVTVRGMRPPQSAGEEAQEVTGSSWGRYLEVVPDELVRFTWLADWAPGEESVVTVRLKDVEGGTLMEFSHENFATAESATGHNNGWNSAFTKLVEFVERD
ncbi:SRPBCC domain-containing protein [Granulicella sp. L60]|jgi:uncharacterized protein YndB with AHSA1/START domain|uniref:SRPBCC family protein n=1 Tax=Granulicella sp. L60 TaxID=1641866 RepID=UPI00131A9A1E|nr:SRPBCC domain-containing protein [Granulicella sp. L60]